MKQLFVTHTNKAKRSEGRQAIFKCCQRKEDKITFDGNSSSANTQEAPINFILNNSINFTTHSTTDSRKLSTNIYPLGSHISINPILSVNSSTKINRHKTSNSNKFLGKKSKIHFDVMKNEESKVVNISNITNFTSSNSQSLDDTIINRDLEKSDSLELSEDKNAINDSDSKAKSISDNDSKGNFYFLNEGRWSFKEHIKFIEAIVEHGKNWKDVQKYVGSRSSTQARSHAQKFFLKLKAIKTPKFDLDFSSNNIKSLSDIIEIIKRKEEYTKRGKEYIISTLTSLSESISIESDSLCKNFKAKIKKNKKDEKSTNQNNITEYNKEIKNELFYSLNDNSVYIEENKNKLKIINTNSNTFTNQDLNHNINSNESKEKKINNNLIEKNKIESKDLKIENIKQGKIEKEVERNKKIKNCNNIKNMDIHLVDGNLKDCEKQFNYEDFYNEMSKPKYIYDDGMLYLSNNSEFFNLNNISLTIKEHISFKNSKLPYVLFNDNFFS